MYARYRKLDEIPHDQSYPVLQVEQQLECLSIAMNSLDLVGGKDAFLIVPLQSVGPVRCFSFYYLLRGDSYIHSKRRKVGRKFLPTERLAPGRSNFDVVRLPDIEREYAHLSANLELLRRDPEIGRHGGEKSVKFDHQCH